MFFFLIFFGTWLILKVAVDKHIHWAVHATTWPYKLATRQAAFGDETQFARGLVVITSQDECAAGKERGEVVEKTEWNVNSEKSGFLFHNFTTR